MGKRNIWSTLSLSLKVLGALIALLVIVTVEAKNDYDVKLRWYFGYEYDTSLWMIIVVSFLVGILVAGFFWAFDYTRSFLERRKLKRHISKLTADLEYYTDRGLSGKIRD